MQRMSAVFKTSVAVENKLVEMLKALQKKPN